MTKKQGEVLNTCIKRHVRNVPGEQRSSEQDVEIQESPGTGQVTHGQPSRSEDLVRNNTVGWESGFQKGRRGTNGRPMGKRKGNEAATSA